MKRFVGTVIRPGFNGEIVAFIPGQRSQFLLKFPEWLWNPGGIREWAVHEEVLFGISIEEAKQRLVGFQGLLPGNAVHQHSYWHPFKHMIEIKPFFQQVDHLGTRFHNKIR